MIDKLKIADVYLKFDRYYDDSIIGLIVSLDLIVTQGQVVNITLHSIHLYNVQIRY